MLHAEKGHKPDIQIDTRSPEPVSVGPSILKRSNSIVVEPSPSSFRRSNTFNEVIENGIKQIEDDQDAARKHADRLAAMLTSEGSSKNPNPQADHSQGKLGHVISSPAFDGAIAIVIAWNSLTMGIETDCGTNYLTVLNPPPPICSPTFFMVSENICLILFLLELILRIINDRRYVLTKPGLFDSFIVSVGIVQCWIVTPIYGSDSPLDSVMIARVVRLIRLTRLMRVLKAFMFFPELWLMANSLVSACTTIAWGFVLCLILVFVFAIIAVEAFRGAGPQWNTMGAAFKTLMQVATLDSWTEFIYPLIQQYPVTGTLFSVMFVCTVSFAMMNLIVAVLTERSIESAQNDKELMARQALETFKLAMADLALIFVKADIDTSGSVSKNELRELYETDVEIREKLDSFGDLDEICELFDMMNGHSMDKSMSCHDFANGLLRYRQNNVLFVGQLALKSIEKVKVQLRKVEYHFRSTQDLIVEIAKVMPGEKYQAVKKISERLERNQEISKAKFHRTLKFDQATAHALELLFEKADTDGDEELDLSEICEMFPNEDRNNLETLFGQNDDDGSGTIDLHEFLTCVSENQKHPEIASILERIKAQEGDGSKECDSKKKLESCEEDWEDRMVSAINNAVLAAMGQLRGEQQELIRQVKQESKDSASLKNELQEVIQNVKKLVDKQPPEASFTRVPQEFDNKPGNNNLVLEQSVVSIDRKVSDLLAQVGTCKKIPTEDLLEHEGSDKVQAAISKTGDPPIDKFEGSIEQSIAALDHKVSNLFGKVDSVHQAVQGVVPMLKQHQQLADRPQVSSQLQEIQTKVEEMVKGLPVREPSNQVPVNLHMDHGSYGLPHSSHGPTSALIQDMQKQLQHIVESGRRCAHPSNEIFAIQELQKQVQEMLDATGVAQPNHEASGAMPVFGDASRSYDGLRGPYLGDTGSSLSLQRTVSDMSLHREQTPSMAADAEAYTLSLRRSTSAASLQPHTATAEEAAAFNASLRRGVPAAPMESSQASPSNVIMSWQQASPTGPRPQSVDETQGAFAQQYSHWGNAPQSSYMQPFMPPRTIPPAPPTLPPDYPSLV